MTDRGKCCECGGEAQTMFPLSAFPLKSELYCWKCVVKARIKLLELIDKI